MSKWAEGTVVAQKRWTERLYSLQVAAELSPFQAGQFAKLALAVDGEMVARPYSFVNALKERPHEFYYILLPGGPLIQRLVTLEAGDAIYIAPQASGFLTLGEVPTGKDLWLLATGTAPEAFQVMICGNPEMVTATVHTLQARGLKKHRRRDPGQVSLENYW